MNTGQLGRLVLLFLSLQNAQVLCEDVKEPTILIAILVRNKAHTLPYFLSYLENLKYPKERISLWIRSDNNIDKSIEILNTWLEEQKTKYHAVDLLFDDKSKGLDDEKGIGRWSHKRLSNVIKLREEALHHARKIWANFVFMLDADVFLTNPNTLNHLMSKNLTVAAPLLHSNGMHKNFWTDKMPVYYKILKEEDLGCFAVPRVYNAVLLDLRKKTSDLLTYASENLENFDGPRNDIITFALEANRSGVPLHICNDQKYGFFTVPLNSKEGIAQDKQKLTNIKLEILAFEGSLSLSENLKKFVRYPKKDTMSMSNVYVINLLRRPERRRRMQNYFDELGIAAEVIDAVDGRTLNHTILKAKGITVMSGYIDHNENRPMTMGEIGCFLSHYNIWNKVIENNYDRVMILEDDVRFRPYFRRNVVILLNELQRLNLEWDLVYIGRQVRDDQEESMVEGSNRLVRVGYCGWALGYILSAQGAKKLLAAEPLKNLIPVDEFLPILYDKHPISSWKEKFPKRNLIALSAHPRLVYPIYYIGDSEYVSDTTDSEFVPLEEEEATNELNNREEL